MVSLLPAQSTELFEVTLEASIEPRWSVLSGSADAIRGSKLVSPPPSFLPFLIYEYGLGELTPYVPNPYTLIVERQGVDWQRVRGTPEAVARGLAWLGHTGTLEDAWHGRAFWNSTQLRLDALPAADDPDLERIEGVTRLSLPLRSHLRRVVRTYDVGAVEADYSRLDSSMLDHESGTVVTQAGTVWSFGRTTEIDHTLTEDEGTAIGNWVAPVGDAGLRWSTMQYPWVTATFRWADNPATQRRTLMAAWFPARSLYLTFRDAEGDVIGHRFCRANRAVRESASGTYLLAGVSYRAEVGGARVYIEAMTDFDDAFDVVAASVEITVGATLADGVMPGKLWLSPAELSGGHPIAETPVSLPLRRTVRERVKIILRF
jgi:hypothetical protein